MPNEPYVEEIMVADGDGDHPSTEEVKYEETQISDDVIGVKGNDETSYRNGYVNITQDDIVGNDDIDDVSDSDLIIFKKNSDSKWYRKAFSKIWDYIKSKIGITNEGNTFLRKDGEWATPTQYPKAVKNITRSGTTFTATCYDDTTFTFDQQDNNTTYPYNIDKLINSSYTSQFRTQTKGNTSQGSYIANIRTNDANVTGAPQHGSGLAWGMSDTHGYIYVPYAANGAFWVGGGNADKLNWQKDLMTGISGISRSGTTFTATRLNGSTFTFDQQDNNTWRPVQNTLTSTSTSDCLSANMGKTLQDRLANIGSGKANCSIKLKVNGTTGGNGGISIFRLHWNNGHYLFIGKAQVTATATSQTQQAAFVISGFTIQHYQITGYVSGDATSWIQYQGGWNDFYFRSSFSSGSRTYIACIIGWCT